MKTKTTFLLTAVTVGLFAFIVIYEMRRPSTREAALREEYVALFDQDGIDGIVITGGEAGVELRKRGGRWDLESPVKDRADAAAVAEILGRCGVLRKEASFPGKELEKKQLKNFGVAKPNLKLKLLGRNAPPEFLFGKETAVEGKMYLRLEGSNNVHIVSSELRSLIARPADAFRDHRLTDVEGAHVDHVSLKIPAGQIELAKQAGQWVLSQPLKARAGETAVTDLIGSLLNTEILSFAPDQGANLNRYGLSEPRAVVTLRATSREQPVTLELGARDEKTGNIYARLPARNSVCLLPPRVERILGLQPNDFRDRRLVRVELDIVDRITLAPAGKPKVILQRQQEDWILRDGDATAPVNGAKVQALLEALQTQEIGKFVADVASDLPKYGLAEPQLKVTFSSYSSENTAEAVAGEQPIVTAAFGLVEGEQVYARAENEPYVVAMDKSILDVLSPYSAEWRSLALFGYKAGEIVSLGSGTVALVREGGAWKLPEGAAGTVDAVNAESMANTLAGLTAMRRKGGELPGEKTGVVSFKTAEGKSHRLILGPAAPGGGCLGAIEGESGVFTISAPDESALRLPLLRQ